MTEIERQYNRAFTFSEAAGSPSGAGGGGISAYEDIGGQIHYIGGTDPDDPDAAKPVPLNVRKSWYQATPVSPVHVGDTFSVPKDFGERAYGNDYNWDTLSVRCTSVEVSDDILRFYNDRVVRLWQVTVEGTTQPDDGEGNTAGMTVKRLEWDVSEELNGSTARTLSGRLVALLKSTVPRRKAQISASGATPLCPHSPGAVYSFLGLNMLITGVTSRKHVIEDNGVVTATIYDYTIDLEA